VNSLHYRLFASIHKTPKKNVHSVGHSDDLAPPHKKCLAGLLAPDERRNPELRLAHDWSAKGALMACGYRAGLDGQPVGDQFAAIEALQWSFILFYGL
jgi:hypothetical protein